MINMNHNVTLPLKFTEMAADRVKSLIAHEDNPELKLRVYIVGGGCNGFQYGFILDDKISDTDIIIRKKNVELVVDPMSLQYLIGGSIDYVEDLKGSRFVVVNPNVKNTCGCGSSFSI